MTHSKAQMYGRTVSAKPRSHDSFHDPPQASPPLPPSSFVVFSSAQLTTRVDDGHDKADSVGRDSSTGSIITPQHTKTDSTSIPDSDPNSVHSDGMAKDPEACLANTHDASQTDPSILAMALITALGLLTSHSSNPKVTILQLSAAVVSFTLIALHSFHSKTLANMKQDPKKHSCVQRLLGYFPLLIFASCWILFLLSVTFTSPKVMTLAVLLVVFASIPIIGGTRLPAALTVGVITLFGLTFFGLVFLVCIFPVELLV